MTVEIRPYAAADEVACRACIVELQEEERRIDPRLRHGNDMADEYLREIHSRCSKYDGVLLVAVASGEIVGLVVVLKRIPFEHLDEPPGDYALVAELVVRDAHRRSGIGAGLLRAAEERAREAGASELRIGVLSGNHAARSLYVREGFASYLEVLSKPISARPIPNKSPL